jgi:hemoglobin/transferrin/lactoferrin receptor protein
MISNMISLLLSLTCIQTPATDPTDGPQARDSQTVPETLVTATRAELLAFDTPYSTEVIDEGEIRERGFRTLPQALRDVPGIMVQETSVGQGSPYIRGFTGFRNVLLFDGIRLNNSVFRDGPNQYWNTIDPFSIERIEVVKGPSSVLYGSDAIGGTVNAITKGPEGFGPGTRFGGGLHYRTSSAERSHIGRGEWSMTHDDFGFLLGLTGKTFGDVQGGPAVGVQPNTGYDEWSGDLKIEKALDPNTHLVLGYQHLSQYDVPRTHSTVFAESFEGTTVGSDLKRDLDQERDLAFLQLRGDEVGSFFDTYTISLSWQLQQEEQERIRGNGNRSNQGFEVGTLGAFAHLESDTTLGRMTYGLDYYRDEVDSFSSSNAIQGPVADDASYDLLGVFVQDAIVVSDRLDVILGGRFNYAATDANNVLDPVTSTRTSIDEDWSSLVGSARFVYELARDTLNLFGGVSQGFRAPNLSDLTRFDSARSNEFEIPSPGLDAEDYVNFELGLKSEQEDLSSQVSVFYTDIQNQIVRFPTGNTNSTGEFEITKGNVGDGYLYGIEVGAAYRLFPEWTLFGNSTYMEGKVDTFPTSAPQVRREYIDRLMPFTSQLGLRWEEPGGGKWAELVGVFAADADRLSTRDKGDTSRIPPGGTPSYMVLHARSGWRLNRSTTMNLALDNLTNEDYRIHGSGQNMPGVNLILGLSVSL